MRPPRLLLLLLSFIAFPIFLTLLSLLSSTPSDAENSVAPGIKVKPSRFRALFSFHTPASLFPPSAVISLTDDNSTFFLARPAAFGPLLPSDGLSSQLWVGSGFGDDRKAPTFNGAEEFGCSDIPGWGEGDKEPGDDESLNKKHGKVSEGDKSVAAGKAGDGPSAKGATDGNGADESKKDNPRAEGLPQTDGTDDHLHQPLQESNPANKGKPGQPAEHEPTNDKSKAPTHADIQSLQESAEIAGKVVLLSRGGCGFLEKVKWVQRRGGVALIVGDDARGGPLITMYARGDTSNVTIPALFTSYTTAHLLLTLVPPEKSEDPAGDTKKNSPKDKQDAEGPNFTAKSASQPTNRPSNPAREGKVQADMQSGRRRSWLAKILGFLGWGDGASKPWHDQEDSRRPPSSGNIDWVLLEDWDEKKNKPPPNTQAQPTSTTTRSQTSTLSSLAKPTSKAGDDFQIGVQDWRDPDVLIPVEKADSPPTEGGAAKVPESEKQSSAKADEPEALKGGSITPGSGEYIQADNAQPGTPSPQIAGPKTGDDASSDSQSGGSSKGWLGRLMSGEPTPGAAAEAPGNAGQDEKSPVEKAKGSSPSKEDLVLSEESSREHEGLWVTLTPATMSTSPLFDTLLVLVVSPLVTLTVVYSLLLVRSRIRRRRWRAPKSVVDRLPVRVYHTISHSSSTSSSQVSTPTTSSPASPLLRSSSRTIPSKNRLRSQTTSSVLPQTGSPADRSSPSPSREKEPRAGVWRKKYTGRQVECVVCLEEYIDGQSRVMSLPCGHEFHADCITPWLVRRRRTCPICKGDVVRSMAQGSSSERQHTVENPWDDVQTRAAETVNESPSAAIPIPQLSDDDEEEEEAEVEDVERGADASSSFYGARHAPRSAWRNLASLSISALSGDTAVWRGSPSDRNR